MRKFIELIADSKSTFVSKASFTVLLAWLGFLFCLRYLNLGMPESVVPITSTCRTLLNYNITTPNLNPEKAESCPSMDYWNGIEIGNLRPLDKKILLTSYSKLKADDDTKIAKSKK